MGKIAEKAEQLAVKEEAPQKSIADLFRKHWARVEQVMPKHMNGERLFQLAVSTVNQTPKLKQCDMATLLSCVMKCSALGLEPSSVDGLGRAYILPFNSKRGMQATFMLGYKGMLDLARRSGAIADISARAVYKGDEFEFEFGLNEKLRHVPADVEHTPENLTYVYCVCHFKDGGHYIEVMTKAEVDAVRARSKSPNDGPWVTDYEAMARKSVVRRAFPYLPVSIEAQSAAAADETTGGFADEISGELKGLSASEPTEAAVVEVEVVEGSEQEAADGDHDAEDRQEKPDYDAAKERCRQAIIRFEELTGGTPDKAKDLFASLEKSPDFEDTADFYTTKAIEYEQMCGGA